jgi:hypothetical protein
VLTAGSSGDKLQAHVGPFTAGYTLSGRVPAHLPPVHPAVTSFRQMNRRQDDKFAKKKSAYIFEKSKKFKKIKKILV